MVEKDAATRIGEVAKRCIPASNEPDAEARQLAVARLWTSSYQPGIYLP